MKQRPKPLPPALPREEWDFTKVPPHEVVGCFWWEYARSAPAVAKAVECLMRADGERAAAYTSSPARVIGNKLLLLLSWFNLITAGPIFPQCSWVRFRTITALPTKHRFADMWMDFVANSAAPVICSGPAISVDRDSLKAWNEKGDVYDLTLPILGGTSAARGETRTSTLVTIDWTYSDQQIVNIFKHNLVRLRPKKDFPPPRRAKARSLTGLHPLTSSAGGAVDPPDYQAELGWLSVLRRRNAVSSWTNYLHLYPANTALRDLKAQCRWARQRVKWFEMS